ncbi:MAG: putative amidophosphoribosyltransferase [Myxococcota bacterium]|jgi:predicted amidophosphoribosyltransferase
MLLDVLFPTSCLACGEPARRSLCVICSDAIPTLLRPITPPPGVATAWILGAYDGPLGAWVRQGKYQGDPSAFTAMGKRLAEAGVGRLPRVDAVTPVPVPWRRRMKRGFDQAELLARAVGRPLGIPVRRMLRRVDPTEQSTRSTRQRAVGARGAFAHVGPPAPERVLLIDDVITSGATARACAEALLCEGGRRIHLLCVASARH